MHFSKHAIIKFQLKTNREQRRGVKNEWKKNINKNRKNAMHRNNFVDGENHEKCTILKFCKQCTNSRRFLSTKKYETTWASGQLWINGSEWVYEKKREKKVQKSPEINWKRKIWIGNDLIACGAWNNKQRREKMESLRVFSSSFFSLIFAKYRNERENSRIFFPFSSFFFNSISGIRRRHIQLKSRSQAIK